MKIVVLGGGSSPERDVSIRSAAAVSDALRAAGYQVVEMDPRDGLEALRDMQKNTIVFPILHGSGGEDGHIQKQLEALGLPYLGTESRQSAVCFSKVKTREVYQEAGLPVARGDSITAETYATHELATKPHVLKISEGGSSIGTYIVADPKNTDQAKVDEVFALGTEAVIEEFVAGVEITVPVLDRQAMEVIEIQPPNAQEFDYVNKYNGTTKEICPPESIDKNAQVKAQELALKAHKVLGCRHLSRTDILVRTNGEMVILETNTIPGMTAQSLLPVAAKHAGMDMMTLVSKFVDMVKRDYEMES